MWFLNLLSRSISDFKITITYILKEGTPDLLLTRSATGCQNPKPYFRHLADRHYFMPICQFFNGLMLWVTYFIYSKQVQAYCDKMYFYCLNRNCKGRFSEPRWSITWLMIASFLSFTFCPCTLVMHNSDKCSVDIVDRNHVLTRRSVLNDRSTAQVEAGRVRAISRALRTAGKSHCS